MPIRSTILLACIPALLAACSQDKSPADDASVGADATSLADPIAPSDAMPAEEPTADPDANPSALPGESAGAIPLAVQGRWGLVPADCTSTRGDAKGLMEVRDRTIRFYESLATLGAAKETAPTRIRATFAYEGEGMQWSRELTMAVQDGGKALVLRESGDDAPPGARRYMRCS